MKKINIDGAFSFDRVPAAIGIVCRDCYGSFQWGFVDKVKSISTFMIEALALKRALMLAIDLGRDKVLFEFDCLLLISCINAKSLIYVNGRVEVLFMILFVSYLTRLGFLHLLSLEWVIELLI